MFGDEGECEVACLVIGSGDNNTEVFNLEATTLGLLGECLEVASLGTNESGDKFVITRFEFEERERSVRHSCVSKLGKW